MKGGGGIVCFSQECLYFPSPLTDASIENIIELSSLLVRTEDPCENVVAFKVLSAVRNRYGVQPSVGLIFAGECVRVKFMLDIRRLRRLAARRGGMEEGAVELPDAGTRDEVFVDICVVPREVMAPYESVSGFFGGDCRSKGPSGPDVAAAFWKQRGRVQARERNAVRCALRCIYGELGVPDSLVMKRSHGKVEGLVEGCETAAVEKAPAAQPQLGSAVRNAGGEVSPPSTALRSRHSPKGAGDQTAASASPLVYSPVNCASGTVPSGRCSNGYEAAVGEASRMTNVIAPDSGREMYSLLSVFLLYKVPFPVCCVLLFLSFLCGIIE
ncbi:hypothetical protein, conserved [Trypanosoma brucei gambiense DAL972]|uniref:Uncharacterized protein n=1 Tax=Trypanosoma brucei gambiense (strain MHOM/CI/86/DAL972) TaxID=679716 RepID=C9ZJH3_TRYB9|nr:hypothetical protein, conserved [Trypanosoma brucei gambiense DAL972]XP_011771852.1 hypothetical protein, conserved [Trypanosoma brucei gambiense DAL972]CBH09532.1 hypothetical protein, conserved [Trypanosoma brucei gambiense DAL972]CBH09547.1 hypothetical protein, conserved [Trypanosoma brucei gambiense DAL972]|eukprot:XP_011771837.1 hypothetical protein, conserved [Trypanosoma brucei gambiense DAL972]